MDGPLLRVRARAERERKGEREKKEEKKKKKKRPGDIALLHWAVLTLIKLDVL